MDAPQPYERFFAWRLTHDLALFAYRLTENFPRREWYGLASQLRKASFSTPANIVEGSCKRGRAEFRRHLDIGWGSLGEAGYGFRFARDLGFVSPNDYVDYNTRWIEASKATWALYASVAGLGRRSG